MGSCDPRTAKKQVNGTLSCLETEFPLLPTPDFIPEYSFGMSLKESTVSWLTETLARGRKEHKRTCRMNYCLAGAPLLSPSSSCLEISPNAKWDVSADFTTSQDGCTSPTLQDNSLLRCTGATSLCDAPLPPTCHFEPDYDPAQFTRSSDVLVVNADLACNE